MNFFGNIGRGWQRLTWHEGNTEGWGIYEPEGDYDRVPFYEDRRVKRIVASLIRQTYGGHSEVVQMISKFVGPILRRPRVWWPVTSARTPHSATIVGMFVDYPHGAHQERMAAIRQAAWENQAANDVDAAAAVQEEEEDAAAAVQEEEEGEQEVDESNDM